MAYILWFIIELVIIYLPLFISYKRGKIKSSRVLVWSTIWATLFTQSSINVLLTIYEYVEAGYTMTASDYVLAICIVLLTIANIGTVNFLNRWFISKEVK